MRLKNNRGEVFTLTVVVLAVVAAFVVGSASKWGGLFGIGGHDQKRRQVYTSKSESKPIIVKDQFGKPYILQATKTETSTLDTSEELKMTLWQKLLMLPKLWLILMIAGLFFPPIAGIMGIFNKSMSAKLKQIIGGMEEGIKKLDGKPEQKDILDTLSKKYDSSTKLLVSKIRRKL